MLGEVQPRQWGTHAQKRSQGRSGGEHANNQPHCFSPVSFRGHIWASGWGSDLPKPFPVPLPCSHAKIQEGNAMAKRGGGTLAGGPAAAPQNPPVPR